MFFITRIRGDYVTIRIIRKSKKIPSLSHKTETVSITKLIQENM